MKKLRTLRNKKGFTLVELIVCLVILAILAAVAIPTMLGYVNKAKEAAVSYETRCVAMAAQTICSQNAAAEDSTHTWRGTDDAGAVAASEITKIAALAEVKVGSSTATPPTTGVISVTVGQDTNSKLYGKVTHIVYNATDKYTWTYNGTSWTKGDAPYAT